MFIQYFLTSVLQHELCTLALNGFYLILVRFEVIRVLFAPVTGQVVKVTVLPNRYLNLTFSSRYLDPLKINCRAILAKFFSERGFLTSIHRGEKYLTIISSVCSLVYGWSEFQWWKNVWVSRLIRQVYWPCVLLAEILLSGPSVPCLLWGTQLWLHQNDIFKIILMISWCSKSHLSVLVVYILVIGNYTSRLLL